MNGPAFLLYFGLLLIAIGVMCVAIGQIFALRAAFHLVRRTTAHIARDLEAGVPSSRRTEEISRETSFSNSRAILVMLQDVSKIFLTDEVETHALRGIDLRIDHGEYVAIAGPSGCGKSTLLSMLGLLDTPDSGRYWLNARPVEQLSAHDRARVRNREIGFIFQSFNLIGDLTVFENVELPLKYRGMPSAERRMRTHAALERVGMAHRARHLPSQLSGGQQQRVAVARAVVGQPVLLLADEPTGNLDSKNGEMVMDLLRELHRGGATICLVTHDPRYAAHADRTIHLFDGKVVEVIGDYVVAGRW